jgi:hypothetical protein
LNWWWLNAWSDDRVENAKKRLLNWVQRLMRQNGLVVREEFKSWPKTGKFDYLSEPNHPAS